MHQIKIFYKSNETGKIEIREEFLLEKSKAFPYNVKILENIFEIEKRCGNIDFYIQYAHDYTFENNCTTIELNGDAYTATIARNLWPTSKPSY